MRYLHHHHNIYLYWLQMHETQIAAIHKEEGKRKLFAGLSFGYMFSLNATSFFSQFSIIINVRQFFGYY